MQSLSVSNLQAFEVDENFSKVMKNRQIKLLKRKFNFGNFRKVLPRNDSGYVSSNSAETIFSIDNNNYVSFRGNQYFKRDPSSQSLYDKSLLDVNEVYGVNFKKHIYYELERFHAKGYYKNTNNKSVLSLPCIGSRSEDKNIKTNKVLKFESRSWEEIYELSDLVLKSWENTKGKFVINSSLQNSYEYFQPSMSVKNSLLLNGNLLLQPLRRYTSEINLRKIHVYREIFRDDCQIDSTYSCEGDIVETDPNKANQSMFKNVSEQILQLVLDLHEFRITDENINKISEKITEIDKHLLSHIKRTDIANCLFSKNICGCKLTSICSVISFSQALSQIINDVVNSKITSYERIVYIVAFIKVAMCLYQKSNWQSLNTLINSLHSFTIYSLNAEWLQIKQNYKHYFDEFIKLSAIIRSSETSILVTLPKGIPDIRNILISQKINCYSKLDRMEKPAKWLQPPGIIDWLEKEFNNSLKTNPMQLNMPFDSNNNVSDLLKNTPLEYRQPIFDFLFKCLEKDLKLDSINF